MGEKDLQVRDQQTPGQVPEPKELTVEQVLEQMNMVKRIMNEAMKPGEHYGVIPGTDKPTLLKPGAEKLSLTFRVAPQYDVYEDPRVQWPHVGYRFRCRLYSIVTGALLGEGWGYCSSLESRYRWREDVKREDVGPVPKAYWDAKDNPQARQEIAKRLYGEGRYRHKKIAEEWRLLRISGTGKRVENPDIADVYNTVIKIGKKRSHVDACLTAFAVSDIFTQDIEDMEGDLDSAASKDFKKQKPKESREDDDTQTRNVSDVVMKENGEIDYWASALNLVNNQLPAEKKPAFMNDLKEAKGDHDKQRLVYEAILEDLNRPQEDPAQKELGMSEDGV